MPYHSPESAALPHFSRIVRLFRLYYSTSRAFCQDCKTISHKRFEQQFAADGNEDDAARRAREVGELVAHAPARLHARIGEEEGDSADDGRSEERRVGKV